MMKPKIIALDLDGTLLDSRKRFPAEFPSWVRSHPETVFVLASGRQIYELLKQFSEIKDELWYIAENGACVYHAGEFLMVDAMKCWMSFPESLTASLWSAALTVPMSGIAEDRQRMKQANTMTISNTMTTFIPAVQRTGF